MRLETRELTYPVAMADRKHESRRKLSLQMPASLHHGKWVLLETLMPDIGAAPWSILQLRSMPMGEEGSRIDGEQRELFEKAIFTL